MKEHTVWYELPDGYEIVEKRRELPLEKAKEWLLTRRRQRYSTAERNGSSAVLTRHVIRCPHCGGELPAYPRFAIGLLEDWCGVIPATVPGHAVRTWAWDSPERQTGVLQLNEPCRAQGGYICPRCGGSSDAARRRERVCLRFDKTKLVVECRTTDLRTLLEDPWFPQERVVLPLPVCERLEFHFGRGRTCLRLLGPQGEQLAVRDITNGSTGFCSVTVRLLQSHRLLRRAVARAFAASGIPLACRVAELRLQDLIEAVRFIGFPAAFYTAIPYTADTCSLDRSFYTAAARLHRANRVEQAYLAAGLPAAKSVRRIFFQQPWMLFYPQEAAAFWRAVESPSVFCRLMSGEQGCSRLAFFHQYPAAMVYFADYCRVKGVSALRRGMEQDAGEMYGAAMRYAVMNPRLRQQEQRRWKQKGNRRQEYAPSAYSVPVVSEPDERMEGATGGYTFRWLRSTNEYRAAGKALENCLTQWCVGMPPVLLVRKNGEPLAAVEVKDGMITQAYLANNRLLRHNEALLKAAERWAALRGLQWQTDPWTQEEEDEELPFF